LQAKNQEKHISKNCNKSNIFSLNQSDLMITSESTGFNFDKLKKKNVDLQGSRKNLEIHEI